MASLLVSDPSHFFCPFDFLLDQELSTSLAARHTRICSVMYCNFVWVLGGLTSLLFSLLALERAYIAGLPLGLEYAAL